VASTEDDELVESEVTIRKEARAKASKMTYAEAKALIPQLKEVLTEEGISAKDKKDVEKLIKLLSSPPVKEVTASLTTLEEFYNKNHGKDGRFSGGRGGGGGGAQGIAQYTGERKTKGGAYRRPGSPVSKLGGMLDPLNRYSDSSKISRSQQKKARNSALAWTAVSAAAFYVGAAYGSPVITAFAIGATANAAMRAHQSNQHRKQADSLEVLEKENKNPYGS
jgi:hypothetical protein